MRWCAQLTAAALVMVMLPSAPARGDDVPKPEHAGHDQGAMRPPTLKPGPPPEPMPGMPMHGPHAGHRGHAMPGLLGGYAMTREASGTSWQPEATPHEALHGRRGPWTLMLHGYVQWAADRQGGERGGGRGFANPMLMGTASRSIGTTRIGFRAMMSADPATIGRRGYPLLLQTGETADGVQRLIDRQHPHDLFMELAATASVTHGDRSSFLYAGLPGEPALGPPVFMHRFSGMPFPEAPIGHHWLDSSHITFGVITAGATAGPVKLDASAFRGREPDQNRWNLERPKLDSWSARLSWNPGPDWAFQVSRGRLTSPEQLEPDVDVDRTTVSVMRHHARQRVDGQTLFAWGRNHARPGPSLDAWLVETALDVDQRHTLFARLERDHKNELFPIGDPRADEVFTVGKLGVGFLEHRWRTGAIEWGLGALGTVSRVPESLRGVYGRDPLSGMLYAQARVR